MSFKFFILASLLAFTFGHHEGVPHAHDKSIHLEVGEHCDLASAPSDHEHGTSWRGVENEVEKICPTGTSCRGGACNCDDLPDGTVMGISQDSNGNRICRRVAGQKCSSDKECFQRVQCLAGVCTCPQDVHCQSKKNDVYILDK